MDVYSSIEVLVEHAKQQGIYIQKTKSNYDDSFSYTAVKEFGYRSCQDPIYYHVETHKLITTVGGEANDTE